MANKKPNWAAWVLRFVGSLAYLVVVWQLWQGAAAVGASGNVFAPVLFGLAAVSAVSLFLMALGSLMMAPDADAKMWNGKMALLGGFALLAVLPILGVAAWSAWSWVALVGFVLASVGAWMDK